MADTIIAPFSFDPSWARTKAKELMEAARAKDEKRTLDIMDSLRQQVGAERAESVIDSLISSEESLARGDYDTWESGLQSAVDVARQNTPAQQGMRTLQNVGEYVGEVGQGLGAGALEHTGKIRRTMYDLAHKNFPDGRTDAMFRQDQEADRNRYADWTKPAMEEAPIASAVGGALPTLPFYLHPATAGIPSTTKGGMVAIPQLASMIGKNAALGAGEASVTEGMDPLSSAAFAGGGYYLGNRLGGALAKPPWQSPSGPERDFAKMAQDRGTKFPPGYSIGHPRLKQVDRAQLSNLSTMTAPRVRTDHAHQELGRAYSQAIGLTDEAGYPLAYIDRDKQLMPHIKKLSRERGGIFTSVPKSLIEDDLVRLEKEAQVLADDYQLPMFLRRVLKMKKDAYDVDPDDPDAIFTGLNQTRLSTELDKMRVLRNTITPKQQEAVSDYAGMMDNIRMRNLPQEARERVKEFDNKIMLASRLKENGVLNEAGQVNPNSVYTNLFGESDSMSGRLTVDENLRGRYPDLYDAMRVSKYFKNEIDQPAKLSASQVVGNAIRPSIQIHKGLGGLGKGMIGNPRAGTGVATTPAALAAQAYDSGYPLVTGYLPFLRPSTANFLGGVGAAQGNEISDHTRGLLSQTVQEARDVAQASGLLRGILGSRETDQR